MRVFDKSLLQYSPRELEVGITLFLALCCLLRAISIILWLVTKH